MSAFKVKGRHLKTGTLVEGLCLGSSAEIVLISASELFGHNNIDVQATSQMSCSLPSLDYLIRLLDGNPFHNPEYETSPALEIADESETFRTLGERYYDPRETLRKVWLGTIEDDHGITRQVQLVITSDSKQFLDEDELWHQERED